MKLSSRCRSLCCALAVMLISALALMKVAEACSHAPPQPPTLCIEQIDATHYCIKIKNYTTAGGAQPGQFCTCRLRRIGPIVSIDTFTMLFCRTNKPVQGWNFVPNTNANQAWSQIFGGQATGFSSTVSQQIPQGICLDLKFTVTVAAGTSPAQLASALRAAGNIVGNAEGDQSGRPIPATVELRPAGQIDIVGTVPCRVDLNNDGQVSSADFFIFITGFFNGNADFNGDGVTTSQDFFDFLAAFFVGC